MLSESCSHDPAQLAALRDRAWAGGRTDIVLDLDLHDSLWAFDARSDRAHLVRLAALLPAGHLDHSLTERICRLASTGSAGLDLDDLRPALRPWCRCLCGRISVHLSAGPLPLDPAGPAGSGNGGPSS
jgi:hypothetical protein